jgi:hypothetical protein
MPSCEECQVSGKLNVCGLCSQCSKVIDGYRFTAWLSLATPLIVLEHHNTVKRCPKSKLPDLGGVTHGTWFPNLRPLSDIGIEGVGDLRPSYISCAFGVVPPDGGTLLTCLVRYRRIIESNIGDLDKASAIDALSSSLKQEGIEWLPSLSGKLFLLYKLQDDLGVNSGVAERLMSAGLGTASQVQNASDATLRDIKGLGPRTISKIRGR